MIQASQKAVFQQTNIVLTQIRQVEIQYFSQFFTNFGTQSILLAGFICGAVSQTPAFGDDCNYFWQLLYNLGSAGCVAFAIQAILGAVFISVFGQGVALRGPLGSMVNTIEGMVLEQQRAVRLFLGAAICYILQEIGMCWVMMDTIPAIVCTLILVGYAFHTYRSTLRIYNRFYWDQESVKYKEAMAEEELDDLHPEPVIPKALDPAFRNADDDDRSIGSTNPKDKKANKKASINLTTMFKGKRINNAAGEDLAARRLAHLDNDAASEFSETPYTDMSTLPITASSGVSPSSRHVKVAGYLTLKVKKPRRLSSVVVGGQAEPWERRYFLLRQHLVYYYENKRAFDEQPGKPLNTRPIDLEGYRLDVENNPNPPYYLSLVPTSEDDVRKAWKFRCDTINEYRNWIDQFAAALRIAQQHTGSGSHRTEDDDAR